MSNPKVVADGTGAGGSALTEAISAAMVELYAASYGVACELLFLDAAPLAAQIPIGA